MNIRFDDSILQDFGDLCSTFFSSTPMFSIEPIFVSAAQSDAVMFIYEQANGAVALSPNKSKTGRP